MEGRFLPVWLGLSLLMSISVGASNEVTIVGLDSNQVLSGVVEIPLDIHIPPTYKIEDVFFILDGELLDLDSIMNTSPLRSNPADLERWITSSSSNGLHKLQAVVDCTDSNNSKPWKSYRSSPIRVRVSNPMVLSIPHNDSDVVGFPFTFPIRGSLAATNAMWKVTISTAGVLFTPSNGTLNLTISSNRVLRVLSGITTNGIIATVWDRKDSNGSFVIPAAVDFEVEIIPIDGGVECVERRTAPFRGRITFPDGSQYSGEFEADGFSGEGTCSWAIGSISYGQWSNGFPKRLGAYPKA